MAERDSVVAEEEFVSTREKLKSGRGEVADEARDMVRNLADQQMRKLGSRLGGVAEALHESARQLERQNPAVGRYAGLAADKVDRVTQVLTERHIDEVVEDAEDFARDQPLLFIGGAMAAGFILSRFIKSGDVAKVSRDLGAQVAKTASMAAGGVS